MQFFLEYEETLPVAPSKCNYSRLVCVSDRPVFFSPGAESEESFKDFGKNREAMRLCREGECFFSPPPPPLCRAKGVFWFWRFTHRHTELDSKTWHSLLYRRVMTGLRNIYAKPDIWRKNVPLAHAYMSVTCSFKGNNLLYLKVSALPHAVITE